MKTKKIIYSLSNDRLVDFLTAIEKFLQDLKIDKKDQIRISLTFEEILLNLQNKFGKNAELSLFLGKNFRRPYITLQIKGDHFNPLVPENKDDEDIFLLTPFLRELTMLPSYVYQHGLNKITLVIRQKESILKKIAIYSAAAILFSFICNFLSPEYFELARTVLIKPAAESFLGILTLICGPLIFFSICTGILSISSGTEKTSGMNTKVISLYLKRNVWALIFFMVFLSFCYPISFSGLVAVNGEGFLKEVSKLLFGIIPSNIVDPFLKGNTIQISLLAIASGMVFLAGSKKYTSLINDLIQLNAFFQNLMSIVAEYSHILIFLLLLCLPLHDNSLFSLSIIKVFSYAFLSFTLYAVLWLLYLSWVTKRAPASVLKAMFPAILLGFATTSSAVAYHEMVLCCTEGLKLEKNITEFSISLGLVFGKDAEIATLLIMTFFLAFTFHIEITLLWILLAGFSIYFIAIATPPVAGAFIIILPVLFSQLHIPMEAMPLGLICAVLMDFLGAALKVATSLFYTIEVACKHTLIA